MLVAVFLTWQNAVALASPPSSWLNESDGEGEHMNISAVLMLALGVAWRPNAAQVLDSSRCHRRVNSIDVAFGRLQERLKLAPSRATSLQGMPLPIAASAPATRTAAMLEWTRMLGTEYHNSVFSKSFTETRLIQPHGTNSSSDVFDRNRPTGEEQLCKKKPFINELNLVR